MGTAVADHDVQEFVQDKVLQHVPRQPYIAGFLLPIISRAQACTYEAMQYFVAWHGVLTIAYSGISSSIVKCKREVEEHMRGVKKENPGSKWPKTTIGCLREDKTLSLQQLAKLKRVCSEGSSVLAAAEPIVVDELSIVLYENRSLEKIITEMTVPLTLPVDTSKPSDVEKAYVRGVLDEFSVENLETYHKWTSKPGNRSSHYFEPVVEATLVHHLTTVPAALARFRERVDAELPGMYEWFADSSLHITIRALS